MARLAELSGLYGDRGKDCLAAMLSSSPLLKFLEECNGGGWELDGTTFEFLPTAGTSTVNYRALNGSLTSPSTFEMPNAITDLLACMYDAFEIDESYLRDEERGTGKVRDYLAKHLPKKYREFGKGFEVAAFNGSGAGTPKQIKGLKTLLNGTDLPGYTGVTRVMNAASFAASGAKSMDLTGTTNDERLANMIEEAIANTSIDGARWLMPSKIKSKISRIADAKRASDFTTNSYGATIQTLWGIPVQTMNTGSILYNEPDDTGTPLTETTSIYLMNPGENKVSLVSNSGLEYYQWNVEENKQSGLERWEVRAQWKIEDPESILRIRNLKI